MASAAQARPCAEDVFYKWFSLEQEVGVRLGPEVRRLVELTSHLLRTNPIATCMKVYSTTTPAFQEACECWLVASVRTVEPDAQLTIEHFEEISGGSDFQSEAFREHNVQKNRRLVSWIRANDGDLILVTDSDIIYVQPFLRRLSEELGEADIALADEGPAGGYNIGQMVIRCSEAVAEFFERVGDELRKGAWDQEAVNRLLAGSGIAHRKLSRLFPNTAIWRELPEASRGEIFSFHATGTLPQPGKSSMERKQDLMDDVVRYLAALGSHEVFRAQPA